MDELTIKRRVWEWTWQAYGDKPKDDYFVQKWPELTARGEEIGYQSPVDGERGGMPYARDRIYGWQAGGADVAPYGPYAQPPKPFYAPIPPFPGDVVTPPVDNPPVDNPPDTSILDGFDKRLAAIENAVVALAAATAKGFAELSARSYTNKWVGDITPKK